MLQILSNLKSGDLELVTVPPPALQPRGVLVRTAASLISAGTEKMVIELAQKSLVGKAQARPDLVRQILDKARKEGWLNTFHNVMSKLERPLPLGYSAAGIVEAVGSEIADLKIGDRVAMAGAGYANHAEVNFVPGNLVATIPDDVLFEDAAYSTVASIALQGVRLGRPELGENVAVIGLGLIGLLAVQILKANGCRVFGFDVNQERVARALRSGMDSGSASVDEVGRTVDRFTRGRLMDLCLITAATKSNAPIELAGRITRRKGQVVVVGAVGLDIPRDAYYLKELEVKVSMSYGPGRYDSSYEEGGVDYPYDYVRWTEQRNMEAVLDLMQRKILDVHSLTTHRFPIENALEAYDLIQKGKEPFIGVILQYATDKRQETVVTLRPVAKRTVGESIGVAFVGAGNYASVQLLPHVRTQPGVTLTGLVTATGLNAQQKAAKYGFAYCTTDLDAVMTDASTDALFIATRHSTHAEFAVRALGAGKHVFVEKPLVVDESQLEALTEAYTAANIRQPTALMVGLNRRFAPMVQTMKLSLPAGIARQMMYRVNSGYIPVTTWLHDPKEGGGMLVAEMCHFVDLMQFVAADRPVRVYAQALSVGSDTVADLDNLTITVTFERGSVGVLCYSTVGDKAASKERFEVIGGGVVAVLDDFRRLEITERGKQRQVKAASQDKGQSREVAATIDAFRRGSPAPIPFDELVAVMRVVFAARQSLTSGNSVAIEHSRVSVEAAG